MLYKRAVPANAGEALLFIDKPACGNIGIGSYGADDNFICRGKLRFPRSLSCIRRRSFMQNIPRQGNLSIIDANRGLNLYRRLSGGDGNLFYLKVGAPPPRHPRCGLGA
jgi:hypothetical protein